MNSRPGCRILAVLLVLLTRPGGDAHSQQATSGTVEFTVTTVSYDGKYAPKNVGAIWVTTADDAFVKTLKLWASKRSKHLIRWNASSGGNTVDAITGATVRSHQTHTATWDCKDVSGNLVPDGTYKIYVEFTEDNSSSSGNPPGKWIAVSFTKGPQNQTVTPPDATYFKAMRLVYTAGGSAPAPASLKGKILDASNGKGIQGAQVRLSKNGQVMYETQSSASGDYNLADVAPESYTLQVTAPGYEPASMALSLNAGEQKVQDIELRQVVNGASLSGRVIERGSSRPVAGVRLTLEQNGTVHYETSSSADGSFSFIDVTAGSYTLRATGAGLAPWQETVTLNPGDSITGKTVEMQRVSQPDTTPPSPPRNLQVRKLGS